MSGKVNFTADLPTTLRTVIIYTHVVDSELEPETADLGKDHNHSSL